MAAAGAGWRESCRGEHGELEVVRITSSPTALRARHSVGTKGITESEDFIKLYKSLFKRLVKMIMHLLLR